MKKIKRRSNAYWAPRKARLKRLNKISGVCTIVLLIGLLVLNGMAIAECIIGMIVTAILMFLSILIMDVISRMS